MVGLPVFILFAALAVFIYQKRNLTFICLFNILCISVAYLWISQKESYIVRYNVKDISTFLL